jgi:hypothetical protein
MVAVKTADLPKPAMLKTRQALATEANDLYLMLLWHKQGISWFSARATRLERLAQRALQRLNRRDLW